MDLFEYMRENNKNTESPLAMRLRPETLDEMVGQSHIIRKVGQVRKAGFRIFSVDDGELKMNIRFRAGKERKIG